MIKLNILIFLLGLLSFNVFSQTENINQSDELGKQGLWIFYGRDFPKEGYSEDSIIEKGYYINGQKFGIWTLYHPNGKPKIKGEFCNNRAYGCYENYNRSGILVGAGSFYRGQYYGTRSTYYDSGKLKSKEVYPDEFSAQNTYESYHYKPDGYLTQCYLTTCDSIIMGLEINFSRDSCELVLDTIIHKRYRPIGDSRIWNSSRCQFDTVSYISRPFLRESYRNSVVNHSYLYSDTYIGYIQPSGKIVLRDEFENFMIFKGVTKNGEVWKGRFYFYADDGTLNRIEKWRKGKLYKLKEYP